MTHTNFRRLPQPARRLLGHGAFCIAVGVAALLPVAQAGAQGVVRKEAQAYRFLMERRAELARAWPGLDPELQDAVRERLVGPDNGIPMVPVLESLALARGVDVDPGFALRGALGVFALPEVVDPTGSNEFCHDLNVTVFVPSRIVDPATEIALRVTLREGEGDAGALVWDGVIEEHTALPDLMRYQGRCTIPGGDLPDGAYTLRVLARVEGQEPRPHDPVLESTVHVCRGFQRRAEAVLAATVDAPFWPGVRDQVARVYHGHVRHPMANGVRELAAAEAVLDALAGEGDSAASVRAAMAAWAAAQAGWVAFAVPGTGDVPAIVRVGPAMPGEGDGNPPGVLVFVGAPVYDASGRRPGGPRTTDPGWLAAVLAKDPAWQGRRVAVLESAGRRSNAAEDLIHGIEFVRSLWGGGPIVLAAEREGAVVASHSLGALRPALSGVFLLGGGGLHRGQLDALGDLSVRVRGEFGTPASHNLGAFQRLLAGEFGELPDGLAVSVDQVQAPWSLGFAVQASPLALWSASLGAK